MAITPWTFQQKRLLWIFLIPVTPASGWKSAITFASPAVASGDIICEATDGSAASISVGIGHLPVLHVLNAFATDGENEWSTNPTGDELPLEFGQGFFDDRQVLVDFTDPNVENFLIHLRLFIADRNGDFVMAGTLETPAGIHALVCDGYE